MAGTFKTAVTAALVTLAVPVMVFSGLGSIGALLVLLFASDYRTSGVFIFFVVASIICFLSIRLLQGIYKKSRNLVESINRQANLNFNVENLLGHPSPIFLVFDKQNKKLAVCNSSTSTFEIHPLSYLLAWHYEWKNRETMEFTGHFHQVGNTPMNAPSFERAHKRVLFELVLELADEINPIMKFYMNERDAKQWCAKLNAIANGY
ncbi:MAG: hypothetical protein V4495_19890 [Pseudomonadota bacterium]